MEEFGYPCFNRSLVYVAANCAPPVGFRENGRACAGCPALKVLQEARQRLGPDAEFFDKVLEGLIEIGDGNEEKVSL